MYSKASTEWVTPQHASSSRFASSRYAASGTDVRQGTPPPPLCYTDMFNLDAIPQRLSPSGSQSPQSSPKSIYIQRGGCLAAPAFVPVCSGKEFDDAEQCKWKLLNRADNDYEKDQSRKITNRNHDRFSKQQKGYTENAVWSGSPTLESQEEDRSKMETQYQVTKLQAQLGETQKKMKLEVERLHGQLGSTEYEMEKLKRMMSEMDQEHRKEIEELQCTLTSKKDYACKLEGLLASVKDELVSAKRSRDSLQNYLRDVPTVEELQESTDLARKLEAKNEKLDTQLQLVEKRLKKTRELLQEKVNEIHNLEVSKEEIEHQVDRLNSSLTKYRERDAAGPVDSQEYEECQWEKELLQTECARLKKLVENKHKKMKALHHQNQKNERQLQEQVSHEEDTINAMRKQGESKDIKLEELRKSVREMSLQNQTLLEENLQLKDDMQTFELQYSAESKGIHWKVDNELAKCAVEFKSLVTLCLARAAGEELNITSLFGVKGTDDSAGTLTYNNNNCTSQEPFTLEAAKFKQQQIKELRLHTDKLRTLISEQYAEDISNNCITQ